MEITLDLIPELRNSEIESAQRLFFEKASGETNADFFGSVGGLTSTAPINIVYEFTGLKGATYTALSVSFFDPFLRIFNSDGEPVAISSESLDAASKTLLSDTLATLGANRYEIDFIPAWEVPETGTYYIKPGWDQGSFHTIYSLIVTEDRDTTFTNIDRIFNFGENAFPQLFPEHQISQDFENAGYYARIYSNGNALGEKDGDIHFYNGEEIIVVGSVNDLRAVLEEAGF